MPTRAIYHNVPVALDADRDLNNGQPAALAKWIDALDIKNGQRVYHLGCGVGYYTAVMAELVGPGGHVLASEADPELARRAAKNLAGYATGALFKMRSLRSEPHDPTATCVVHGVGMCLSSADLGAQVEA